MFGTPTMAAGIRLCERIDLRADLLHRSLSHLHPLKAVLAFLVPLSDLDFLEYVSGSSCWEYLKLKLIIYRSE